MTTHKESHYYEQPLRLFVGVLLGLVDLDAILADQEAGDGPTAERLAVQRTIAVLNEMTPAELFDWYGRRPHGGGLDE